MPKEIGGMQKIMLMECGKYLQHNKADDFVLATGETHSVREFVELAFELH